MRMKISILLFIGLGLMFNNSCRKKEASCSSYVKSATSYVDGPTTGQVNQDINITIHSSGPDGCTQTSGAKFTETVDRQTRTIQVMAKHEGCVCTLQVVDVQSIYTFKASQPGIYTLKFLGYGDQYVEHVITVR